MRPYHPTYPGLGVNVSDVVSSVGRSAIRSVTVRSAISPTTTFTGEEIFGPGTPINVRTGAPATPTEIAQAGAAQAAAARGERVPASAPIVEAAPGRAFRFTETLMRIAKPEVEVDTPMGRFTVAPYGRPRVNYFWPIMIVGAAGTLAVTILIARGLRRR